MAEFDPDKYLSEKTGGQAAVGAGFDPDAYLAEKRPEPDGQSGFMNKAANAIEFGVKDAFDNNISPEIRGIKGLAKVAGWAGDKWERYADAPFRAGLGSLQDTEGLGFDGKDISNAASSIWAQFGNDALPSTRTHGELFAKTGLLGNKPMSERFPDAYSSTGEGWRLQRGGALDFSPAGAVGGLVLNPANLVAPGEGTMNNISKVAKYAGEATSPIVKKAGSVLANVVGHVDESTLAHYVNNRDRIRAFEKLGPDAAKDALDSGVKSIMDDTANLEAHHGSLEEKLNAAYEAKQAELHGSVTPLGKAKEMSAGLETQKGYLHSLSEQANDALARSGKSFSKKDLLNTIDGIGKDAGTAIGDEQHAALSKLQVTRDRIATQLPDNISAVQMRDVLQQLRKDIGFDMGAGEFNDTLNGMRKSFSGKISAALKSDVPEYAGYMERMSGLSENLSNMNRYFGDESKALGSLETLRKGGAKAQLIEDVLRNHAELNGDKSLLKHLEDLRQNQTLSGRIKAGEDLRKELFPQEWAAVQDSKANLDMSRARSDGVSRLTENNSQAKIKNQGGKSVNVMDRRAIDNAEKATGEKYHEMIADKNTLDKFQREGTRGGRLTVLGGAVGGWAGSHIGMPQAGMAAGAFVGSALDKYGAQIVRAAVDMPLDFKAAMAEKRFSQAITNVAQKLVEDGSAPTMSEAEARAFLLMRQIQGESEKQSDNAMKRRMGNK